MEVAPFFVDFHHFLSIFTIFYRFSRFTHFCCDLHFVPIYALFPQFFFGQNSLLRNITRFLHVCQRIVFLNGKFPYSMYKRLLLARMNFPFATENGVGQSKKHRVHSSRGDMHLIPPNRGPPLPSLPLLISHPPSSLALPG